MKKVTFLLLFSIISISFLGVNAGWYGSYSISYSGSSPIANCGTSYCETIPNITTCGNGDLIPSSDNRTAVEGTDTSPVFTDNPSDNDNHEGDFITGVPSTGNMNCYYWDDVFFDKSTYELYDYNFNSAPDYFGVSDGKIKTLDIDFQLETLVDGVLTNIFLDDSDKGIDTINFTFKFLDNTVLNQFDNTGGSSVEAIDTSSDNTDSSKIRTITYDINGTNLSTYSDLNSKFIFKYEFYNSTMGDFNNNDENFILQDFYYTVKFKGGSTYSDKYVYSGADGIELSNVSEAIKVKPLYEIDITGELSNTGSGFIGGRTQTGGLEIIRNSILGTPIIDGIYLHQSGSTSNSFIGSGIIDNTISSPNKLISKLNYGSNFIQFNSSGFNYILKTLFFLVDELGSIDDIKDLRVYQYIKYSLGGKNVIYLAGILNQNNNQSFETLKIFGITNIDKNKQKDLIVDQDSENIQNLNGKIYKSFLKKELRSSAIKTTKFINTSSTAPQLSDLDWSSSNDGNNENGRELGNILYFNENNNNVIMEYTSDMIVYGQKTIIVKGGNLYIKSNIINSSSSDILGIIVLKDEDGNGGKLYIDQDVQRVDAVIYTDKSIMSAFTSGSSFFEIDGFNNGGTLNQLYINGSIFSENTIGASRLDPPVCPFYTESITGFTCDFNNAQKYDLNYLRTGYNNKYDSNYGNYPIIIKYNSTVQSTPPPLFEQ